MPIDLKRGKVTPEADELALLLVLVKDYEDKTKYPESNFTKKQLNKHRCKTPPNATPSKHFFIAE